MRFALLVLVCSASCIHAVCTSDEETCVIPVASEDKSLLQKKSYAIVGKGLPERDRQELPIGSLAHRKGILLEVYKTEQALQACYSGVSQLAPLNAQGFLEVTSMCCPVETEAFFNRLLADQSLQVCSKRHVQGLMHWFSCVPLMDYQYVLDVIANGNPCKYWAPKGEACPVLSPECGGRWCDGDFVQAPATEAPITAAPATTAAPTTAAANTAAPTTAAPTTAAPTTAAPTTAAPSTAAATTAPPTTEAPTTAAPTTAAPTTAAPTTAAPTTTAPDTCSKSNAVAVDFQGATVAHSNLGGVGPDTGSADLRYAKVGTVNGQEFDIVVTVAGGTYNKDKAQKNHNGIQGSLAKIAMSTGLSVDFEFTFMITDTSTPVELPEVHISVLDIDGDSSWYEDITARGFSKYVVDGDTKLVVDEGVGRVKVHQAAGNVPNPVDVHALTQDQKNAGLMLVYKKTSSFIITFAVHGGTGRSMFIAGASSLDAVCEA